MLGHPDARDRVERPIGDLAVVLHADLDPVGQSVLRDLFARPLSLRDRQRRTDVTSAVVWVIGLLVIGVACGIGAWFVIREAGRLAAEPPPPVFDMDEAFDWVVAHLPDLVAATLTADDVRRILDFQLEFFQRQGVTGNGSSAHPPGDVVVGGAETVDYIVSRSAATGEEYLPEQVHAVVETQLAYLRAIGAVGDAAATPPTAGNAAVTRSAYAPEPLPDLLQKTDRRKEVVQQMHDKSGTLEVRGR